MNSSLKQTVEGHFENDNYVFFWDGPFSNWYPAIFHMDTGNAQYDAVRFSSSEQAMMFFKAHAFDDVESAAAILATQSPREQKAIGRAVKNFDSKIWDSVCIDVVTRILVCKFRASPYLKDVLLNTKNKHIVEASPFDTVWGIGMGVKNPDILDVSAWKGKNYLGICLMHTRAIIKNG